MTLIDVGGYRLDLRTTGNGAPAVVCLSALGGGHDSWERFAMLLADTSTVVTYGRPTLGGSDPLPEHLRVPIGAAWPAEQLRTLLAAAGIAPPYMLVTCSVGGYIAHQYAALWPDEVAGAVWIDPSPPWDFPGLINDHDLRDDSDADGPQGTGLLLSRAMVFDEQRARPPQNRDGRFVVLSGAVGRWLRSPVRDWHQPLTLAEVDAHWVVMQRDWAARLRAVHLVADEAGHFVQHEAPELAAAVVREIVTAAREDRSLRFDPAALAAVGGQLVGAPSTDGGAGTAG